MAKFPPLFKRISTNPEKEGKLIAEIQKDYEDFYHAISRKMNIVNSEKTMGMRKLQESCMWMTRAIALSGFRPDEEVKFEQKKTTYPKTRVVEEKPVKTPETKVIVKKKKQIQMTFPVE